MKGVLANRGCAAWALTFLAALLLVAILLVYIDYQYGAEASAFFLGLILGIPLLLVVVVIVGSIYVLVIRGTVHIRERDDSGEISRMRALGELARTERAFAQRDKAALDWQRVQARQNLSQPPQQPALPVWPTTWPEDDEDDDAQITIIE